ncbi:MAG: hypothetical protein RLZZ241_672 [Bacteroidota bacterium]|jgi:uridine phosphorylase
MNLAPTELILNPNGSIYHLNLTPEDLAPVVILVGDPERVPKVSKYFDRIELKKSKREFVTHTGFLGSKRISVLSTGIGTDNIDIVLNELDALVNIDLNTRIPFENTTRLNIIRIGTSGALQPEIAVDSTVLSEFSLGLDGLLQYYESKAIRLHAMEMAFVEAMNWHNSLPYPYGVSCDSALNKVFSSEFNFQGITATLSGFYGPQGRRLRLNTLPNYGIDKLASFEFNNRKITNLEMETAGIFGLSALLGHSAVSLNCILANRFNGTFSENPNKAIDRLIQFTLERIETRI